VSYRFYEPQRGDVVVVEVPDSEIPLLKRVIGLEGETVEIRDDQVYINGRLLTESYLTNIQQADYGPTAVPVEHVFVMGDNRSNSRDSRAFGPVDIYRITGRAWLSMWPVAEIGTIDN
jgi:signal peptidase I